MSITSVTQGFLGFLILRGPAYPGPKGWKLKPCSSENEAVPVGGQSGNGRGYQGEKGSCSLLGSSRCLGAYACPSQTRLSFPGEEEQPGPDLSWVCAWHGSRKSRDADVWRKLDIFPESVQFTGDDIQSLSPRKWNTFPWQPQGCVITQLQNVDSWKKASSDIWNLIRVPPPLINVLYYFIWNREKAYI